MDRGPIAVDYVVGERRRRADAIERVHQEVRKRAAGRIDAREIDYSLPDSILRFAGVKYGMRTTYYAAKVARRRRRNAITQLRDQQLGILLHEIDVSPCVAVCFDTIEYTLPEYRTPVRFRAFVRPYHTGTAKADLVVAISEFSAAEFRREFKLDSSRVRAVPIGVDHARYRPSDPRPFLAKYSIPGDRPIVLYLGSEQPRKRVPAAVKAFIRARREIPDLIFVKIGRADELPGHPERAAALRLLEESGSASAARFLDFVPEELLPAAYSSASAFIFPSRYEGFGLPVVEAMACGTPVVTTNVTALPEVAGDAALLVPPEDDEALAQALLRLLREKETAAALRERGLRQAAKFDWARTADGYLALYEELARRML
jgi:glycosyltransferase involved in cell wall biosynthesis